MAKGNASNVNKSLKGENRRINSEADQYKNMLMERMPNAVSHADQGWDSTMKGYQDILDDPYFGSRAGGGDLSGYGNMFKNFAQTGGLSDENRRRIRGSGVFDEFAKTGGYSDADLQNIRQQSQRIIPSYFESLRTFLDQKNRAAGGNASPAYDASMERLARDQSRGTADAVLNSEVGLKDKVNEGRRWGGEHISSAELGLGDLESRNKIAGMEGGSRIASAQNELASGNRLAALAGIRGLRTDVPGEEFGLYDYLLKNQGQRGQLAGENLGQYSAYNPNISIWDRIPAYLNAGANIAATAMGGPEAGAMASSLTSGLGQTRFSGTGNRVSFPSGGINPRRNMRRL